MYDYRVATLARTIDGDTYDFDLDLGFHATLRVRVRLAGIDTFEVYGKNAHPKGGEAREFAAAWMTAAHELRVATLRLTPGSPIPDGSFGRWLGIVYDRTSGEQLVDALRAAGYEKTT